MIRIPSALLGRRAAAIICWLACAVFGLVGGWFAYLLPNMVGAVWFTASFVLLSICAGRFRWFSGLVVVAYGASFWYWCLWLAFAMEGPCEQAVDFAPECRWLIETFSYHGVTAIPTALLLCWGVRSWRPTFGVLAGVLSAVLRLHDDYAMALGAAPWCLCVSASLLSLTLWPPRGLLPGVCACCGYSLAGLAPDAQCPECGTTMPSSAMDSIAVPAQGKDTRR